ncbi:hypothetical protein DFQ28_006792 [Apophysomyces sp. BC1034]|nr:hypothetical protein DFQ30_006528 [Apophysomyces sp. BC1015]KAG0176865.1 hypothetical protein DFQ29_005553 [Apophysomyces sp. BC1021]KAG0187174.1 hypothetical protein DFQ28_006792 [Apophysomyces sp. BC1034]
MRLGLFALCATVLLAVTVHAAPVEQHHNAVVETAAENPVIRTDIAKNALSQAVRSQEQQFAKRGGVKSLTEPAVQGVANPLGTGVGRGVAGAAGGTQQAADLFGDALDVLAHTLGGIAANTEQGAGVAVANAGNAVQNTVSEIQSNSGAIGDVVRVVGG